MGYTHYYGVNLTNKQKISLQKKYESTLKKCNKLLRHYQTAYGGLSGYSAHTTYNKYKGIKVNGSINSGMCEDFVLPELLLDLDSEFVKTNRHAYDTPVVACLLLLSNELPGFEFNSDGYAHEMVYGLNTLNLLFNKQYKIPKSIRMHTYNRDLSLVR